MFRLIASAFASQVRQVHRVPYVQSTVIRTKTDIPPDDDNSLGADLTQGELKLIDKLKTGFPNATHVQVSDISGGCGAMYQIAIESSDFIGKSKLQQQKMVNALLAEEIKEMHGLQLTTKAPDSDK